MEALAPEQLKRAEEVNASNRKALEIVESLNNEAGFEKKSNGSTYMGNTLNPKSASIAQVLEHTLAARVNLDTRASKLGFELEHLAVTIGTIIHGPDLAKEQSDQAINFFHDALRERKVIFFRNQQHITTDQHLDFGRRFGPIEVHPFIKAKEGYPEVVVLDHGKDSPGQENVWHSDVTWREEPSLGSILRCLESPDDLPEGGDTHFADMYLAFEGLPALLKEQVRSMKAIHTNNVFLGGLAGKGYSPEQIQALRNIFPPTIHPIVRTHPWTGKECLYVNTAFSHEVDGMEFEEGFPFLMELYKQAAIPEYQCRFRWERGSIAFWDNRASQHYASSDYYPFSRTVERVTVMDMTRPYYSPGRTVQGPGCKPSSKL